MESGKLAKIPAVCKSKPTCPAGFMTSGYPSNLNTHAPSLLMWHGLARMSVIQRKDRIYCMHRLGKPRVSVLKVRQRSFSPRPCYESLTNNVSTPLLRTKLNDWPEGTPNYVKHHVLKEYIQDTSKKVGVDDVTIYGALVTRVYKDESEWHVLWTSLEEDPSTGRLVENQKSAVRIFSCEAIEESLLNSIQTFDAVVIASGHYHTPLVPDIPGLAEAKAKWSTKITHSKSFRNSEGFEGKVGSEIWQTSMIITLIPVQERAFDRRRRFIHGHSSRD